MSAIRSLSGAEPNISKPRPKMLDLEIYVKNVVSALAFD